MISARETVFSFIESLNDEDFGRAAEFLDSDMKFEGVLGSRDGARAYITDMEKMKMKYDIRKLISEEEDVAVLYDIEMSGKKVLVSGWYHVVDGKIKSLRVIFDPRPVL